MRIADKFTALAGSIKFVYIHAALFTPWMLFFARFVMIGQNRQAGSQHSKS